MVNFNPESRRRLRHQTERGMLMTEMLVAMAILLIAVLPVGYSFIHEAHFLRTSYYRAVAMEIVDGEIEILAAGEGRAFPEGRQTYTVHADAATNLPPSRFELTRAGNRLRLEWVTTARVPVKVVREATLK